MTTSILPGIIQQRWSAAEQSPSIPQWRSIGVWLNDLADQCQGHPNTDLMVPELRRLADEAFNNMRALQRVREPDEVAA